MTALCVKCTETDVIQLLIVPIICMVFVIIVLIVAYLMRARIERIYTRYKERIVVASNNATMIFITYQVCTVGRLGWLGG